MPGYDKAAYGELDSSRPAGFFRLRQEPNLLRIANGTDEIEARPAGRSSEMRAAALGGPAAGLGPKEEQSQEK